jgi:hypothetical protein
MVNPGMFGFNSEQMAQARQIGEFLRLEITKYRREGRFEVKLISVAPNADYNPEEMVDSICHQFAAIFNTILGVKGKIINVE